MTKIGFSRFRSRGRGVQARMSWLAYGLTVGVRALSTFEYKLVGG